MLMSLMQICDIWFVANKPINARFERQYVSWKMKNDPKEGGQRTSTQRRGVNTGALTLRGGGTSDFYPKEECKLRSSYPKGGGGTIEIYKYVFSVEDERTNTDLTAMLALYTLRYRERERESERDISKMRTEECEI